MPVLSNIKSAHVPVKIWSPESEVESQALKQLQNVASLPFVFKHVAAMPDVHLGIGATVGSVIATKGAVIPAAVGVDIGCGMIAARLNVNPELVLHDLDRLRAGIERVIPLGHESNKKLTQEVQNWKGWKNMPESVSLLRLKDRAAHQLGSLGGGNHFIEICTDEEGAVWVMLHSGSRNVGKSLAEEHIREAKGEIAKLAVKLPDPDLAYYLEGTTEYENYMRDLEWAQSYALENREEMLRRVMEVISHHVGKKGAPLPYSLKVNCHHNYATREVHYGEDVLVTRKGAVRARQGDLGIIPGSMGARSYIVRGKGSAESFDSCSHGAGRRMSRSEAKRRFSLADLQKQTAGVECRKDAGVIDEIPSAYKDIDQVMKNQTDLVDVVAVLKQVLCVKG
ncbi:RtcB family protein [Bdellovibrio bacteriovorus]|uniref:3'-phosphate/5'-hydroxy nucleic acid ligase n=1 Tax=Bdellovibrio bacteriovorus str. Tiberius TaxID=1069642 RepID=K7YRK0_BDEBC|nr:RtcB family protein [Bdellovibrio bacteriovorus]AFY02476.1 putative cytoplasmic protein [Bdellovibrio bacteriovorus str. Tiberius]